MTPLSSSAQPDTAPDNGLSKGDRFSQLEQPHFMLKEIHEQPAVIQNCLNHYLDAATGKLRLGLPADWYPQINEFHILACGTSRHAGLVGQFWIEQLAGIPARIRSGSEFQEAPLPLTAHTLTIGVTQSGETTDTLKALEMDKQRRMGRSQQDSFRSLGITNQASSSLAQMVDVLLPTLAGQEIGVAATKTFTTQLVVFFLLTLDFAQRRQCISESTYRALIEELQQIPLIIQQVLQQEPIIQTIAAQLIETHHCILLGRGVNRAIALEGALKLKETTYLHAEGYAAGEFMHGPIALLDEQVPVIAIAPSDATYEALRPNVQKAKSHGSPIIGLVTSDTSSESNAIFDTAISLPQVPDLLTPLITVIPLQLLAYHLATLRGLDVDRPRNITKTIQS